MLRLTAERPAQFGDRQGASVNPGSSLSRDRSHAQGRTVAHYTTPATPTVARTGSFRLARALRSILPAVLYVAGGACLIFGVVDLGASIPRAVCAFLAAASLWMLGEVTG